MSKDIENGCRSAVKAQRRCISSYAMRYCNEAAAPVLEKAGPALLHVPHKYRPRGLPVMFVHEEYDLFGQTLPASWFLFCLFCCLFFTARVFVVRGLRSPLVPVRIFMFAGLGVSGERESARKEDY